MSFVKRYSSVRQDETVFTGNTLCLSPLADVTGNIAGSGAFDCVPEDPLPRLAQGESVTVIFTVEAE